MTTLDPDNQQVLDLIKASGRPPVASLEPSAAREVYRACRRFFQPDLPDMAEVRDLSAPGAASSTRAKIAVRAAWKPSPLRIAATRISPFLHRQPGSANRSARTGRQ